jgi:cytochrome P450
MFREKVQSRISTPYRRRFGRAKARIERQMITIIQRRRERLAAGELENDLLDILLNARDAAGVGWTDGEIAGEMHAAIRAGQDTTTSSVVWALLMIARHPQAEARLHAELQDVLGERAPEAADLARLPYLRAVYDESLRLFPPIPTVARIAAQDDAIRGHRIPRGSIVVLVSWLTHRDPRWWPHPDKFDPERFLNGDDKAHRPKYAYFPFGGGARFCLGAGLALLQGPLILATLAQKYRLCVADGFIIRPRINITLLPEGGLPVTLKRR